MTSADPLFDHSIYLAGTYPGTIASGRVTDIPFTMTFDLDEKLDLGAPSGTNGMLVEDGQLKPIIIAFRLAKWFEFNNTETNSGGVIDLANLVVAAGPVITLDETGTGDSATIREIIKANTEESADFGKDNDGSGEFESDEDDDPDTEDANDS